MLVQVKDNQPTLNQGLQDFIARTPATDHSTTADISRRNRHEQRSVRTWLLPQEHFGPHSPWSQTATLIEIERSTDLFHTPSGTWQRRQECSLYLCTRSMSAAQAAHAVRQHWAIENRLHHVRDRTLREDASRIRRSPGIFARLRSWALNLLRFNNESNIAQALFRNALDFQRLQQYEALL